MPLARHVLRRRVVLALALLAMVVLVAAGLLAAWGAESQDRARYEQVQVGMSQSEAQAILDPTGLRIGRGSGFGMVASEVWYTRDGARINVYYDGDGKVRDKDFEEGDQSFTARVKRLAGRVYSP